MPGQSRRMPPVPGMLLRFAVHLDFRAVVQFALGVVQDFSYQSKEIVVKKGETIFLYTDGVTEAMNEKGELFSQERMVKELAMIMQRPVEEVVAKMFYKITTFSKEAEQADDITMMVLRFYGK